jgi:hypothetical protein
MSFTYRQNGSAHGFQQAVPLASTSVAPSYPGTIGETKFRKRSELNWHYQLGSKLSPVQRVLAWQSLRRQMSMTAPLRRRPDWLL